MAHELSRGVLLDVPRGAIVSGWRDYARPEEDEVAWLSGRRLFRVAGRRDPDGTGRRHHQGAMGIEPHLEVRLGPVMAGPPNFGTPEG